MREEIIHTLKAFNRPLGFREILTRMGLKGPQKKTLKRALKELVKEGKVIRTRKGRYGLPEEMRLLKGFFEAHEEGYGFVIPEGTHSRDIFVPPWATMGAMDGDRVIVRVENEEKRQGRIIRILQRAHKRVVGWLQRSKGLWIVRPKRKSDRFFLYVPRKGLKGAMEGDLVVAEVLDYPSQSEPATGRILKKLKKPTTPKEEMELLIDEFELPRRFPTEVSRRAKALKPPGRKDFLSRQDHTDLKTVTIDGEKARDFDDAISIKRTPEGYTLFVHIADVSHYVKWDNPMDREARKRGCSVYLPDRVVPMLPKVLSEDLCSLKPEVKRLAFTVRMDFSEDAELVDVDFYPSVIISDERMTYSDVKKILIDRDDSLRKRYQYLLEDLELMAELTHLLRQKRLRRGSLDFDLPEPDVILDITGAPEDIIIAERNFAHMIIEEFMIAANEAVAGFIYQKGVPSLYRVHAEPEEGKLMEVVKVIKATIPQGIKGFGLNDKRLKPSDLPGLLEGVKGSPVEDVINYIVLRSLKQARYSTENIGHFGLASPCYTHFTSPIRRYPDLIVHRILKETLSGQSIDETERTTLLEEIAFHSSMRERYADEVEYESVRAMRAWFMKDRVGEEFDAKVVSVSAYGMRVRLNEYFVEGFIHVSYMTDDYYQFDEQNLQLLGKRTKKRYRIGDPVVVKVLGVDLIEREVNFGLL